MRFETPSHLRRDVVWSSNERMCKTTLVFPLSPSFQRLHPMGRRRGTRTPTRIQVQIPRVHWVLSAVAWKKGISQPFFALILIVRGFHQYWSHRWESCRCSGNTCCCGSSGTQCTDQSPSAWCAHWHLRRRIVNQLFLGTFDLHYSPLLLSFKMKTEIPIKILSGLMSRWMKPILWTLSTAHTSSEM